MMIFNPMIIKDKKTSGELFISENQELLQNFSDQIFPPILTRAKTAYRFRLNATFGDVTLHTYRIVGQFMIDLWLDDSFISFVGSKISPRRGMALHGCNATLCEMHHMIAKVSQLWDIDLLVERSR